MRMRTVLFLAALMMGLTVAGTASAATVEDKISTNLPILTPQTFRVALLPSGDLDGSGTAVLTVDLRNGTVCYDITVTGIGEPTEPAAGIGNAHIHSYTLNGAIAVDLETQFVLVAGTIDTYRAIDCVTAPRQVLVDILLHPEDYYVNVHTTSFPGGAVQGDLA
jgi:CHRD domain